MTVESTALEEALHGASEVVRRLESRHMSLATPCPGWSVADVLNHVVATTTKFTQFAEGQTDTPRTPRGDLLLADPWLAFEQCRAASATAWRTVDWQRTCRLPFGAFSAAFAAAINTFDALVHTWDLAQAVAMRIEPSRRLVQVAHAAAVRLVTAEAVARGQYAERDFRRHPGVRSSWPDLLLLAGRNPEEPESAGVAQKRRSGRPKLCT